MNLNKLKIQLLSPMYLVSAAIMLPLRWLTSTSVRMHVRRRGAPATWTRRVLVLRSLVKHCAQDLGLMVLVDMAVPAAIAGGLAHSVTTAAMGAAVGFSGLTLLPVMLLMPSRERYDSAATGNRFIT
jgi:hypothetical protein